MKKKPKAWITVNGKHIPIFTDGYENIGNELDNNGCLIDPKYTTKRGATQIQKEVNPNYQPGDKNCGKCALAFALREMGYNVEALNGQEGGAFFDAFDFTSQQLIDNFILADDAFKKWHAFNKPVLGKTVDSVVNGLYKYMKQFGDGAIAILNISHANSVGGHAINVVNKKGKILFIDAQNGRIIKTKKEVKAYFGSKIPEKTSLVRVDNVKLFNDWKIRCKNHIKFKKGSIS